MPDDRRDSGIDQIESPDDGVDRDEDPFPFLDDDHTVQTSIVLDGTPEEQAADERETTEPEPDQVPGAELVVTPPDGASYEVAVSEDRVILGRNGADIVFDDPFVSPWHAQLCWHRGDLLIEDANSYNGIFLRIANDLTLEDGDEILLGRQRFAFRTQWDDPESDDRTDLAVPRLGAPISGMPVRLLRYLEGGRLAGVYPVESRLTIGSDAADLVFPDDFELSAPHAAVVRDGEAYVLRDLDSEAGTYLRIGDEVQLVDGDRFVLGRTRIDVSLH